MEISKLLAPPRSTANPAPARPANSVRRTSSIDVSWPDGIEGSRLVQGRVRDYHTGRTGGPGTVLGEAWMEATLDADKTISAISANEAPEAFNQLIGQRGGNHLRLFIKEVMPELISTGAPLYLALDDISGSALVSPVAWSQWHPDWIERFRETMPAGEFANMRANKVNVCWGLQEGNTGVSSITLANPIADADAGDLRNPSDPEGWNELPAIDGPGFRRARRIDVSRDDASGVIRVNSSFQDSSATRDGGRIAIHEYLLTAEIDAETLELRTLVPEPRILPFPECPGAVANTRRLIGRKITEVRTDVLDLLRGPDGCTHLNDALRAMAEVPILAEHLAAES